MNQEQINRIADLVRARSLVIFAGAGISIAPPSSLPSFLDLQNELLWALSKQHKRTKIYYKEVYRDIKHRTIQTAMAEKFVNLIPEYVFQVCKNEAGELALEPLKLLDFGYPNPNHLFLAKALREGYLPTVVTTNFDCLIEEAFECGNKDSKKLYVAKKPADFEAIGTAEYSLMKLHGSIDVIDTIAVSLNDIGKRCVLPTLSTLKDLLEKYSVFVTGYRGSDLDVFACLALTQCNQLIWNTLDEQLLIPKVQHLLRVQPSEVVIGDLNLIFKQLAKVLGMTLNEPAQLVEGLNFPDLDDALQDWALELLPHIRLGILGEVWNYVGESEIGLTVFRIGHQYCIDRRDTAAELFFIGRLANVHYQNGNLAEAEQLSKHELALSEHLPTTMKLYNHVHTFQRIGLINTRQGLRPKKVVDECYIPALRCQEELERIDEHYRYLKADVLNNIANVFFTYGLRNEAIKEYSSALTIYDEVGDVHGRARALAGIGNVFLQCEDLDEALNVFLDAAYLFTETNDLDELPKIEKNIALTLRAMGNLSSATYHAEKALNIYRMLNDPVKTQELEALVRLLNDG